MSCQRGIDQVMGLLGVRHVERHHVRLAEQLVERQQLQLQLGARSGDR